MIIERAEPFTLDREQFERRLPVLIRPGFPGLASALLEDRAEIEVVGLFSQVRDELPAIVVVVREGVYEDTVAIRPDKAWRIRSIPWSQWEGHAFPTNTLFRGDHADDYASRRTSSIAH